MISAPGAREILRAFFVNPYRPQFDASLHGSFLALGVKKAVQVTRRQKLFGLVPWW